MAKKELINNSYLFTQIQLFDLLADRTNGRAIGTVLRLSVCLWRYVLWLYGA